MYLSYYVFICSLSYFPLVNVVATAERPAKYIYIVKIYRNIYSGDENTVFYFCMSSTEQSASHLIDALEKLLNE